MRNFLAFLVTGICLLGCQPEVSLTPWDLISKEAHLVMELPSGTFDSLERSGQNALALNFLIKEKINLFVSLHETNATDHDILFLATVPERRIPDFVTAMRLGKGKLTERSYGGTPIFDISAPSGNLSFALVGNVLVFGSSALLVEKAMRQAVATEYSSLAMEREQLAGFTMLKSDDGNLFINNERLTSLLNFPHWVEELNQKFQGDVPSLLDFKHDQNTILLNGFSLVDSVQSLLKCFQRQQAVPVQLTRYVPNFADFYFHFGINDLSKFEDDSGLDSSAFVNSVIGDEFIIFGSHTYLPSVIFELNEKVSLPLAYEKLKLISTPAERYDQGDIRVLNSSHPIRPFLSKFSISDSIRYFFLKENFVLLSSSIDDLKRAIEAIDRDETWGKSIQFQTFFEKCLQESNFSLMMKDVKLQAKKSEGLNKLLKSLGLQNLQWGSVQHSALDNHFYTNINIAKRTSVARSQKSANLQFDSSIRSVEAFSSGKSIDILVEDENTNLHFVSEARKELWKVNLAKPILDYIHLVDYFKNKKTQFQIATESNLFIIDRVGKPVSGYPFALPKQFKYSSVVDYDKSGNYRFLFATKNQIFLFDKQRKSLPGWNPKTVSGEIDFTPEHHRIGGKDYFLILQQDASVHLFTRRGDYASGYPKAVSLKISGDYFLSKGSTLQNSFLLFVTSEGELAKVCLGSSDVNKIELVRSKDSNFRLIKHQNLTEFSVARIDPVTISFFDAEGKIIFEVANPGSTQLQAQVFKRSSGDLLYAIFDDVQKLTYLFDQYGSSLPSGPIESSIPVTLQIDPATKTDLLFVSREKTLSIIPLQ